MSDRSTTPGVEQVEASADPRHSHEPEIRPILDDEGRCLVCVALLAAQRDGFDAGMASVEREPLWLLTGDLEWLEFAIADYVWKWGQHLPGVHPEHTAGTPVAVANMAMSVIRKNVRRIEPVRASGEAPRAIGDVAE